MNEPSYHDDLKRIFAAACEIDDPDARRAAIIELCAGNDALRRDVESLLDHDDAPVVALDRGADEVRALHRPVAPEGAAAPPAGLPAEIGPYRILDLLGEGGMGVVYLAEQREPRRVVALKVLRRTLSTPALQARFRRESDVLARLQHPAIASIYASGTADDGQSYFAMEYVRGAALTAYVGLEACPLAERVRLLVRVIDGVQHAHERGVLHRDLKPANILVDADGAPKILDFGVARLTDRGDDVTMATQTGQVLGTVPYMSPEQVSGRQTAVDARTDVYALGVLGFELITGRLPYDMRGVSLAEAAHIIRDRSPDTLSTVVRDARGDLDTIIGKALEKDPARRYHTAGALADDLRRYLDGRPILARPPSAVYLVRKFAARHRALFAAACLAVGALMAATVVSTTFAITAARARAAEAARADDARRQAYIANLAAVEAALQIPDVTLARQRWNSIPPPEAASFEAQLLATAFDRSAGQWSTAGVDTPAHGAMRSGLRGGVVYALTWNAAGTRVACGTHDGRVFVGRRAHDAAPFDVPAMEREPLATIDGSLLGLAFADDDHVLIGVTGDGQARAWSADDGAVRWSGTLAEWAAAVDAPAPHDENGFGTVTVTPDGTRAAFGAADGRVYLRDVRDGSDAGVRAVGPAVIWDVAFTPDGATLVAAGDDGDTRIVSVTGTDAPRVIGGHGRGSSAAALHPSGTILATSGTDGAVRVWRMESGALITVLGGHTDRIGSVHFSRDGASIITSSSDATVRVWAWERGGTELLLTGHRDMVECAALAPAGDWLVTGSNDESLRFWHLPALRRGDTRAVLRDRVAAFDVSSHGVLAVITRSGVAELRDAASGAAIVTFADLEPVRSLAFSRDGARLAFGGADGAVMVITPGTDEVQRVATAHDGGVVDLVALAGERWASVGMDGRVCVFDAAGHVHWHAAAHEGRALTIAASPDGAHVATGGVDQRVGVFDARTGRRRSTIDAHRAIVSSVQFADATTVVSGDYGGVCAVHDVDGRQRVDPMTHALPIIHLAVAPEAQRLAVSFTTTHVEFYDTARWQLLATVRGLAAPPMQMIWSPDESELLLAQVDRLRVWSATSSFAVALTRAAYDAARARLSEVTTSELDAQRRDGDALSARAAQHELWARRHASAP